MGWFNLWGNVGKSDKYYTSYEKSFENIDFKLNIITERRGKRSQRYAAYSRSFSSLLWASLALAAAHIAWLKRQPFGTYTFQQHAVRTLASLAVPLVLYVCSRVLIKLLAFLERRDDKEVKKLNDSKKKMLKELKDSTRFERTMALIKKYDPDAQPVPTPLPPTTAGGKARRVGDPGSALPGTAGFTPGATHITPGSQLLARTGGMAVAAAAGAGKALFPVFDTLANSVIGDSPHLLDELRRAQAEAEALKAENQRLKALLAQLQAPDGEGPKGGPVAGKGVDSGGKDLALDQGKGKVLHSEDALTTPTHARKESEGLALTPPDSGLL